MDWHAGEGSSIGESGRDRQRVCGERVRESEREEKEREKSLG